MKTHQRAYPTMIKENTNDFCSFLPLFLIFCFIRIRMRKYKFLTFFTKNQNIFLDSHTLLRRKGISSYLIYMGLIQQCFNINFEMKNQITYSFMGKAYSLSKSQNAFPSSRKGILFEGKELQTENKQEEQEVNILNNERQKTLKKMCESIRSQSQENEVVVSNEWNEEENVQTSCLKEKSGSQNILHKVKAEKAKQIQPLLDDRNLNILLNKQASNTNYLQMQTRELLKLTHINILHEEEKEIRQKISLMEIACRKMKITLRNGQVRRGKSSQNKVFYSKQYLEKEKELNDQIKKQKTKSQNLNTKLLLLHNYFIKKSEEHKIEEPTGIDENDFQNEGDSSQKCQLKNYGYNSIKYKEVLFDRMKVMKESIQSTTKYTKEKVRRIIKENGILRRQLELINSDLSKYELNKDEKRYIERSKNSRSFKFFHGRHCESSITKLESIFNRKSKKSLDQGSEHNNEPKQKMVDDYQGQWKSKNSKVKIKKLKSQPYNLEEFQSLRKMQEYIATEYFHRRTQSKQLNKQTYI